MGANSTQAVAVTAFLLGFTALPVAIMRGSFLFYLVTAALLVFSAGAFLKCKPLEHAEKGGQ